jgi:hypothetical protein
MANYPKQPDSEAKFDENFPRQPMVDWFAPSQLFDTGIKALLSKIFGAYADKREMQAVLQHKVPYFDYSKNGEEFWLDYIADLGDGWNSTYSMAKLLAQEQLSFEDGKFKTERGKILIMGGDEVYPTATREAYNNRLDGPYQAALPYVTDEEKRPHLFAIPGNHDWYDGLTSFIRFFCQSDNIGGWKTRQTRSYFAIKLPHNWWLWGIDIQLNADIDKPQQDFFKEKIAPCMQTGDKVILCTAEPEWVHAEIKDSKGYENLVWFEKEIIRPKGVLAITLTGDLHHYCRYEDSNGTRQKIIAGGGGAYLYPTHKMPEKVKVSAAEENAAQEKVAYSRAKVFPEVGTSGWLAFGALLLPFKNWKIASFIGLIYLLYAWILQSVYMEVERDKGDKEAFFTHANDKLITLMDYISELSIFEAFRHVGLTLLYSPEGVVLTLMTVFGLRVFCDKKKWKWVGSLHGIAHLILIVLLLWFFSYLNLQVWNFQTGSPYHVFLFSAEMIVVGGLLGSSLVGLYLVIGSSLLGINVNEVFACQSIPDYKNFLRLHIDKAGKLTVYPIGVKKVSRKWKWNPEAKEGESWFEPNDSRGEKPHLIEEPLEIKLPKD